MQRLRASIAALVTASAMAGFGMNCQGTDARVFAVTPTDHLLPADFVFVQGRNFGGTMTAELLDPADPVAVLPTPVVIDVQPNSLRVSIPSFSTARRPYTLRIRKNGQLAPSQTTASSQIYLRSFGSTPPAQDIRIQHIAWGELQIFLFAENAWFHFPPPYTNSGNDEWTGDWIVLKPLHDQASRDWATICGAAWNLGATRIVRGIAEDVPRESLTWNFYTRMDVTVGNPFLQALAAGQMLWDPADRSSLTGHLAGRTFGPCATETDPVACAKFVGERPNTVVIHHVTKMFQDGLEVNPATDFRALVPPEFPGMIIASNNPCLGCRPDPPIGQPEVVWPPDQGAGTWSDDPARPPTPNLFGHELVHAAAFLVDEPRDLVVQVSDPAQHVRSYGLDSQPPNPPATHAQNCGTLLDGFGGRDFTR